MSGFKKFLLRGNVVDLAVAVVVGAAFGAVVTTFVKAFVTPLIGAFGGIPDFSAWIFTINGSRFLYGDFINALITFLTVSLAMFFLVMKPVNALMERFRTEPDVDKETRDCPECLSTVPASAKRCAHCTSALEPSKA